jgi:hypothetical protein
MSRARRPAPIFIRVTRFCSVWQWEVRQGGRTLLTDLAPTEQSARERATEAKERIRGTRR